MVEKSKEIERFYEIFNSLKIDKIQELNDFMNRFAVNFNLYKDGSFIERSFPFDMIPRIISNKEYDKLERGLTQRVYALNLFLNDIYGKQQIIKDGVIPEFFITSAKGFLPEFMNVMPHKGVRSHISGIDLVKDTKTDDWVILEDNLRVPSGASYPLSIRSSYRKVFPEFFEKMKIKKIKFYPQYLQEMMDYVSCGGINVVLTPGRYNSAFYEHSFLAKETGAKLVTHNDLEVIDDKLYFKNYDGNKIKVGTVYRRLDDDFLDPVEFRADSLIGIPNITNVYRSNNVALVNAIGNGVADDKAIYYFVPKMIEYYLGEKAIMKNAPTYLPYFENDKKYILDNIHKLVIKDVSEAGGYGVVFGHAMTQQQLQSFKKIIIEEPRRFIAQELIEFYDSNCLLNGQLVPRKTDFRSYVVYGKDIKVWNGGLTRYALEEGNYLVNSSQGGGFKDTWVMEE